MSISKYFPVASDRMGSNMDIKFYKIFCINRVWTSWNYSLFSGINWTN